MEISRLISNALESLRPGSDAQQRMETVEKTFQELLKQQAAQTSSSDKPLPKTPINDSSFQHHKASAKQMLYNKQGQLIRLSVFKSEIQSKLFESGNSLLGQNSTALSQTQAGFKWPSEIMATLLQQSFDFIREQLDREKRYKRKKEGKPKLPDGKSEEDALELLDILFEQADEATDMNAFCDWASESITNAENAVRERSINLPPEVEMRFKIMHDAILALRNGLEPNYIRERLIMEIKRKKEL